MGGLLGGYGQGGGILGAQDAQTGLPNPPADMAPMYNFAYGMKNGGLVGGMLGAAMGAQGVYTDPNMAAMQMMRARVGSLMQANPGMTLDEAVATVQNAKLQENRYGLSSLGAYDVGGNKGQVLNNRGKAVYSTPTPEELQALPGSNLKTVKPGETLVDLSLLNKLNPNNAQAPQAAPGQAAQAAPEQPAAQPGAVYQNATGLLGPEAVDFYARQLLAGDSSVLQNLGRSNQGAQNITAVRTKAVQIAKQNGMNPEDVASSSAEFKGYGAAQDTLGHRLGNVMLSIQEARNLIPQAEKASSEVYRVLGGQYMPVNKIINAYQENTGDPAIVKLGAALYGLSHMYARAVNPQGVAAESDLHRAEQILDQGLSKNQLSSAMTQLMIEMQAMQKAPGEVQGEMRKNFTGSAGVAGKGSQSAPHNDPLGIR